MVFWFCEGFLPNLIPFSYVAIAIANKEFILFAQSSNIMQEKKQKKKQKKIVVKRTFIEFVWWLTMRIWVGNAKFIFSHAFQIDLCSIQLTVLRAVLIWEWAGGGGDEQKVLFCNWRMKMSFLFIPSRFRNGNPIQCNPAFLWMNVLHSIQFSHSRLYSYRYG